MDFDEAKENIQPLAQGRDPGILQASIKVLSHQELMAQRKELEREIHNYKGDDPLSAWYAYIEWIEQSYPSGGKESGLQEVLSKCLNRFESEEKYFQDRRMIRLYIKYIDKLKDPAECYQQLFNAGIGTMVSDFYIAWAYCYDLVNNTLKADEVFKRGIACRAQPLEELQEAHQHFGFTVSQRLMYKDDHDITQETNRQLEERRLALSSLRGHRRKQMVGSIRTGAAVKSVTPGVIKNDAPSTSQHRRGNTQVAVYSEENECPNIVHPTEGASAIEDTRSVVRTILEAQRDEENLKEPGPWNKPHKKGKLFGKSKVNHELGFEIHMDDDQSERIRINPLQSKYDKPIKLPLRFCSHNRPQSDWIIPVTTEETRDRNCLSEYNKCKAYPRPNMEFQPEEYKAYVAFLKRNISNRFTQKRDVYWGRGPLYNLRMYPHFAKQSNPQKLTDLDRFYIPPKVPGMQLPFDDLYNEEEQIERQYEEILSLRIKRNETIFKMEDMEETICVSSERVQRRKSFYPMRKSMAPCANPNRGARKMSIMSECIEENEEKDHESTNQSCTPAIFEDRETFATPKLLSKAKNDPKSLMGGEKDFEQPKIFKQKLEQILATSEATSSEPLMSGKGLEMPKIFKKQMDINPSKYQEHPEIPDRPISGKGLHQMDTNPTKSQENTEIFVEDKTPEFPKIFKQQVSVSPKILSEAESPKSQEPFQEGKESQIPKLFKQQPSYEPSISKQETSNTIGGGKNIIIQNVIPPNPEPLKNEKHFANAFKQQLTLNPRKENLQQKLSTNEKDLEMPKAFENPTKINQPENTLAAHKHFEIFQDESFVAKPKITTTSKDENGFAFKTPALPVSAGNPTAGSVAADKPNKIYFEIFEDLSAVNTNAGKPSGDINCGSGGYFDADETCSTQIFNIHLKAQSVSTPKPKLEAQRQFGTILKDTLQPLTQPIFEHKDEDPPSVFVPPTTMPHADINDENCPVAGGGNAVFSPTHRKQLSTILETSENGTTQSTHTTGATTKSTISSPEFEQETQVHNTNFAGKSHVPTLGTVRERTLESSQYQTPPPSSSSSSTSEAVIEEKLNSMKISANQTNSEKNDGTPPGMIRSDPSSKVGRGNGGLDFSIFEDPADGNKPTNVGNFSRLEERQETATGYAIRPIKFQEDKTETITRMMLAPAQHQLQLHEDKTEPIPPMILGPSQPLQFQEDKTETISKMLLAPPEPIRFQEDKTETISKLLLAPPAPASPPKNETIRFEDELPQMVVNETNGPLENKSEKDDLFEFFSQSPPKYGKAVSQSSAIKVRPNNENRTPLLKDPKRFCDIDTPNMQKNSGKELLFPNVGTESTRKSKSVFRDSFMPDFSLIEDSGEKKLPPHPPKPKSVLRDSFMPDFSLIENKQETARQTKAINHSHLPDLTHIPETQKNDSIIPDSQPMMMTARQEISLRNNQNLKEIHCMNSKSKENNSFKSSFLNDFSCIPETQQMPQEMQQHHQNMCKTNEGQPSGLKNILTDNFMKDFSEIKEPPPIPMDFKEMSLLQPSKNNSTLKYLEETINHKSICNSKTNESGKSNLNAKNSLEGKKLMENEKFFELNAETEMFGTNVSMIKNSTMLHPNHHHGAMRKTVTKQATQASDIREDNIREENKNPSSLRKTFLPEEESLLTKMLNKRDSQNPNTKQTIYEIQEESIHIKEEKSDKGYSILSNSNNDVFAVPKPLSNSGALPKPKLSFLEKSKHSNSIMSASRFSIDISQSELEAINKAKRNQNQLSAIQKSQDITQNEINNDNNDDDFGEMSIYYKNTPKTPKAQVHVWDDEECQNFKTPSHNRYTYVETDLNQTMQMLENVRMDPNVNPFSVDLINAFLEQIQFTNYITNIPHCMLVGTVHRLKAESEIKVNAIAFKVNKLIGEGAYGAVFVGRETIGGKKVALKQEKPANLWEYYICLEIQDRIRIDEMLPAFMSVEYALIGNNSSVLISQYSEYGSLIVVCNKIKKHTLKNVDEYVVMVLACELLEIIDHLHAISIIHADIKADNFLLMNKVKYPSKERSLQLIDFGVSIDMKLFRPQQTFSYVHSDNSFKCVEMREERPWTYQLDLYGLAGVIHVLLFGKYMEIAKKPSGIWMHKTHVPRYFNRDLWETIFKTLLNIRDCNSMPNLQGLRALLKEEIEEKEKYVLKMINEFNRALDM